MRCVLRYCGILLAAALAAGAASPEEDAFLRPVGRPPAAKAQRRQGGESLPPLPLPATPLRRSEKKHPPAPTTLIGKVIWGGYLDYTWPNGVVTRVFDWNMVPADAQQLLRQLKARSGLEYQASSLDLGMLSGDPSEVPVLLISGGRRINFTPEERAKLRKYLLDGGMIWFDSVVGSPFFLRSAAEELRRILPEAPLRRVPADHPVFHIAKSLVAGETNRDKNRPFELEGLFLGPRLAAVISPVGLGCGWDNTYPELIPSATFYRAGAAVDLGVNLALYAIGWFDSARRYAAGESGAEPGAANPEQVPFAQLVTDGFWNSDPGAGERFLRHLGRNLKVNTAGSVNYVNIDRAELSDYPFCYLGGLGNFQLSDAAAAKLRRYLDDGGFLLINNTMGLFEFDAAVRKLVARLYPGRALERIPENHPLFTRGPYRFSDSGFSAEAAARYPNERYPLLYGVNDGDRLTLIYSPVDLAGGWQQVPRPGSIMYTPEAAGRLGGSIASYFLTH